MTSNEIRKSFLKFFAQQGHTQVDSSSLVPGNDATLLFANSGMVQFKDVFLGKEKLNYSRAASSQRCVRAGGKHNDLENVGYTTRHHTFFEMLGNFSFGDYFKSEAIHYAWDFIVNTLSVPPERLWVTVFEQDDESAQVWLEEIGIVPSRLIRIGGKDNFWSMGEIGPCGPCTEIFYDHGESVAGGLPGTAEQDGDRFVEIWNLVFMQYEKLTDGKVVPLPNPSVDTGMGLERITAVIQGVSSNYDTDLFQDIIRKAAKLIGTDQLDSTSLKVIADHIRACSWLITDGVVPSNEDRGYVLRRIIRRAVRHAHKLGGRDIFFYKLVDTFNQTLSDAYPELLASASQVKDTLKLEEERFVETLDTGLAILENNLKSVSGTQIPGELIFQLYDTYGFPADLSADIARERNLTVDWKGFEQLMQQQQTRARQTGRFTMHKEEVLDVDSNSDFLGYQTLHESGKITHLFSQGKPLTRLQAGDQGIVVLDQTPFYAESGGQIGDCGTLNNENGVFVVEDTQKQSEVYKHIGLMKSGTLTVGDAVSAEVNQPRREKIVANHSATHLLHQALREILGDAVNQKGSLVADDYLRFDFSYHQPVSPSDLEKVEMLVNTQIQKNYAVQAEVMPKEDALKKGAVALFGEKYGKQVRVLSMGDFSIEFCGGTHVNRSGDIGIFKITGESGIASGVRRIEAVTGITACQYISRQTKQLKQLATALKTSDQDLLDKVKQLVVDNKAMEKDIQKYRIQATLQDSDSLTKQAVEINGIKVLAAHLDGADRQTLRATMDSMKARLGKAAVVLASTEDNKVRLVVGVTKNCTELLQAGSLANMVAEQVGGKGGGRRDDLAEAGGTNPAALDAALSSVHEWVRAQIQ